MNETVQYIAALIAYHTLFGILAVSFAVACCTGSRDVAAFSLIELSLLRLIWRVLDAYGEAYDQTGEHFAEDDEE